MEPRILDTVGMCEFLEEVCQTLLEGLLEEIGTPDLLHIETLSISAKLLHDSLKGHIRVFAKQSLNDDQILLISTVLLDAFLRDSTTYFLEIGGQPFATVKDEYVSDTMYISIFRLIVIQFESHIENVN